MFLGVDCINFSVTSSNLNYNNFSHDIERVIILYGKTKQKKKLTAFLKSIIKGYPESRNLTKWRVRLEKIQPTILVNQEELTPDKIEIAQSEEATLVDKMKEFRLGLPEFNFYHDLPNGMETFEYLRLKNIVPMEVATFNRFIREGFKEIIDKAKILERQKDYKSAIETYLNLVNQEYEDKTPYERLMIIYRKLKWKDQELEILKKSIKFYKELRVKQKTEVLVLAKKYNKEQFALDYINKNKRIQYYGGLFDLYNPFTFIEEWEKKLTSKTYL